MEYSLEALGKHLAKVRKEHGFSQEKLALESGIARSYMSDLECGRRNVGLLNIFRLADTMGIKPIVLLDF